MMLSTAALVIAQERVNAAVATAPKAITIEAGAVVRTHKFAGVAIRRALGTQDTR